MHDGRFRFRGPTRIGWERVQDASIGLGEIEPTAVGGSLTPSLATAARNSDSDGYSMTGNGKSG